MSHEAESAERSLRELHALTGLTRSAGRSQVTGLPLIGWGTAYVVGLTAVALLDGLTRVGVVALAYVFGLALSWLPLRDAVRTGTETRMRMAWVAVLLATPCLVVAARPESFTYAMLLAGGLWGLAMCLYGIATGDAPLAAVAGAGTILAAALAAGGLAHPLAWFGVTAGLPLVLLGAGRVLRVAGRV